MKPSKFRRLIGAAVIGVAAFLFSHMVAAAEPKDVGTLFQQGRAAYYKGDFETAKLLLSQVAALKPDHFETKALLASIDTQLKSGSSLRKTYGSVTIPKIDFADVTLAEALQALSAMAKNASGGKVAPNFIVRNPDLGKKQITLNLTNIPLTDAIDYIAQLAGGKAAYDKHAVVFSLLTE